MKVLTLLFAGVISFAAFLWILRPAPQTEPQPGFASYESNENRAHPVAPEPPRPHGDDGPRFPEPGPDPVVDGSEYQAHVARERFEDELRRFLATADNLAEEVRERRAHSLIQELLQQERRREVSAAESALLQVEILRRSLVDESARERAMAEVLDRYRAGYEARMAEWAAREDPEFEQYKEREARIVREVMALEKIPGGLDRGAYLRQRLWEARIEVSRELRNPN